MSLKQSLISFPSQSFIKNKEINNSGTKFKKNQLRNISTQVFLFLSFNFGQEY